MATELPEYQNWIESSKVGQAFREIVTDVPRRAAVLAGAMVEDQLKRLIELSTMPVLEKGFRSLPYQQCADWAYRFGLIDKQLHDELGVLGTIRNMFAHRWDDQVDFDTERVAREVKKLKSPVNSLNLPGDSSATAARNRGILLSSNHMWWAAAVGGVIAVLNDEGNNARRPAEREPMMAR